MKNKTVSNFLYGTSSEVPLFEAKISSGRLKSIQNNFQGHMDENTEILFITSYPPRECGIATYSQDLIRELNNKFSSSLSIKVCALESGVLNQTYPSEVKYTLNTSQADEYAKLAVRINNDDKIKIVLIQHEFGFFKDQESVFMQFLYDLSKPIIIVFHTVLPHPNEQLKSSLKRIAATCSSLIVMTPHSAEILKNDYEITPQKISVIGHGTHLVTHLDKEFLKIRYGLKGRKVLTTFGLLSSGKGIETTLDALPAIVKHSPEVIFLVIGKTHPEVVKNEGEKYRDMLEAKVALLKLTNHVKFINSYLSLSDLLEYLQLTDIYLFTTNDPYQAVSGTFVYAMSCACPIISTPIPHAKELLNDDTGIIFDFRNTLQLATAVNKLLKDEPLRRKIGFNALQKIASTAWENSAVAHALLFKKTGGEKISLRYNTPIINLAHLKQMTTNLGMLQFAKINQPDNDSNYTLDDNARALVAICMHFELTGDEKDLYYVHKYLTFITRCLQAGGDFINYIDKNNEPTDQNNSVNLEDANGRAIWALGYLISLKGILPEKIVSVANAMIQITMPHVETIFSPRAMAFAIKGLYYYHKEFKSDENLRLIRILANRMTKMYKHESSENWKWYEGYLTYANSVLPEAMLYSWLLTGNTAYKEIALASFNFLLSQIFNENGIEVISNKNWFKKEGELGKFGEQPIDVSYTIMSLSKFYDVFLNKNYLMKMETAFNWFLGSNRLHQIMYNPCTGGCYDGLEETYVNINQGAASTLSYLMARLTIENYKDINKPVKAPLRNHLRISGKQNNKQTSIENSSNPKTVNVFVSKLKSGI